MAFNQQHNYQQHGGLHRYPSNLEAVHQSPPSSRGSHLIDSEWILFSPNASLDGESEILEEGTSYGDVLSTEDPSSYREESEVDVSRLSETGELIFDEEDRRLRRLQEEGESEEDDDDLVQNLSDVHADVSALELESEDLNTRIDKWRKQQIADILKDIKQVAGGSQPISQEKRELIQSWGIDDSTFDITNSTTMSGSRRNDLETSSRKNYYGSDILQKYSSKDLRIIKKVVHRLSRSLLKDTDLVMAVDHKHTPNRKATFSGHYSNYLRNMNALNREEVIQSRPPSPVQSMMSNRQLEKYLPIFLRNLIASNLMSNDDPTPTASTVNLHASPQNDNFWNNDLKSCNSSLLTISTNSIIFNKVLHEVS
ncbi:unnamed protein product [Kuraishia capsulata CBS 1993]|uniref:Uncharacterized protein n=1 Tax=Kuraishia capsulata CBS 1993 TaxID=1382522 RepID=W6MNC3_9ASCO|nr:uncharacterized protein KUCA_T00002484001 [Kuraishia capsulata CBS 1993]CDK26512.1 unnamed protein product [Kuraishia capsulata CBS 1993]